jgi:hypothetical protein
VPAPAANWTGIRIGLLTVLERLPTKGAVKWRCKCDCGKEADVYATNLRRGHTKSCGCLRAGLGRVGERHGKLVVIEETLGAGAARGRSSVLYRCKCDCGKERFLTNKKLGRTMSCGCEAERCQHPELKGKRFGALVVREWIIEKKSGKWLCDCDCGSTAKVRTGRLLSGEGRRCVQCSLRNKGRLSGPEAGRNHCVRRYVNNADMRGLSWDLAREDLDRLFSGPCFYCGHPPSQKIRAPGKMNKNRDHFLYSGIDRVDSEVGYTRENCVSCCPTCNFAKGSMDMESFKTWVRRVFAHMKL